jgi:hypothetical protein
MKGSRLLLCALVVFSFLSFSSVVAHADSIPGDPVMQVDDPQCTTNPTTVTPGAIFNFSAGAANSPTPGGGCTAFRAANGELAPTITSLDIETFDPNITDPNTQVNCLSNAFGSCTARLLNGVLDIFLTNNCDGDTCGTGIAPGQIFSINLSNLALDSNGNPIPDPNTPGAFETVSEGGWIDGEGFGGIADPSGGDATTPFITTPEPSSLFLLAIGIAALSRTKKLLKTF